MRQIILVHMSYLEKCYQLNQLNKVENDYNVFALNKFRQLKV